MLQDFQRLAGWHVWGSAYFVGTVRIVKKQGSGCGAAELCLTSVWSDRQERNPRIETYPTENGFGDAELNQTSLIVIALDFRYSTFAIFR